MRQRQAGQLRFDLLVRLPELYTYGSAPRNFLDGPGLVNFDMSFFKNFSFGERVRLQFRWEFFNIFNHPNFGNPKRQTQFGLKLMF